MESTPLQSTSIRSYRDLKVWQMGIDLVVECYQLTGGFPRDERFSLTQQRVMAEPISANTCTMFRSPTDL